MSPASLQTITKVLWACGILLEWTGVIVILKRRLWREIPAFSSYLLFSALADSFGSLLFLHATAYYYYFWVSQVAYKVLNTWVILEIYVRLMRSFPALRKVSARTLWAALILGLVSAVLVWFLAPLAKIDPLTQHIEHIGYSLKMIQLGLLVAVAVIVHFFRLRLRRYYVFIAAGIAIVGLGDLASYALISALGYSKIHLINVISLVINTFGEALWVYVLLTGEPAPHSSTAYAAIPIDEVRDWNRALSDLDRP